MIGYLIAIAIVFAAMTRPVLAASTLSRRVRD
jgi:hypothetical protein